MRGANDCASEFEEIEFAISLKRSFGLNEEKLEGDRNSWFSKKGYRR